MSSFHPLKALPQKNRKKEPHNPSKKKAKLDLANLNNKKRAKTRPQLLPLLLHKAAKIMLTTMMTALTYKL